MDIGSICPSCLEKVGIDGVCACGFDRNSKRDSRYLPYGTVISERYLVGKVLEENGDGITYLGLDKSDGEKIRIREFFPSGLCRRNPDTLAVEVSSADPMAIRSAKEEFRALWRKLANLRGISSIVTVFDIVDCNNTVYSVSEYNGDITLRDYLMTNGGFLSWEQAKPLLMPVIAGIKSLHVSGICHLGLSPYTLFVGDDGKVRIWGFSIKEARCADNIFTPEFFEGFTPIEQYDMSFRSPSHSLSADVYSFACVLYRVLVGSVPIDSKVRYRNDQLVVPAAVAEKTPAYVINALVNALQVLPDDRTADTDRLRDELSATPSSVERANARIRKAVQPTEKPEKKERIPVTVISRTEAQLEKRIKIQRAAFGGIILVIAAVLVFLSVSGRITLNDLDKSDISEETEIQFVIVPNFVGGEKDNNTFETDYPGLKIRYEQALISYTPENKIVGQSVAAGTKVAVDTEVILSYYGKSGTVVIPDLTGLTKEEALLTLGSLGLNNCKFYTKDNVGAGTPNTVESQTPEADGIADKDYEVVVYVWGDVITSAPETTVSSDSNGNTSQRTNNATSIIDSVFSGISGLFR